MPKYVLFDLDGTLIDGVDDLVHAMNLLLSRHGLPPLDRPALEPMLGDGMRMLTRRAFAMYDVELPPENFNAACADFLHTYEATQYRHTRLHHGVTETLRSLHADGWIIGLASNKPTEPCNGILTRLGVRDLFTVVAGGDATTVKKPHAGHLHFALRHMGYRAEPEHFAVMVGDHANDVDAARAAGIPVIAVAFEVDDARARSLAADAVVTDFKALPAVLTALLNHRSGALRAVIS